MEHSALMYSVFFQVVGIAVVAWLTASHLSSQKKMDKYVDSYLQLNWSVEDIKSDILKIKNPEFVKTGNSKIMSEQFESKMAQIEAKMIRLETTNIQLVESNKGQKEMRQKLAAKMKQLETKVKHQELLIFALQKELSTSAESSKPAVVKSKGLGNSFTGESGDFRTCHGIHSADPLLPSGMYWIDPDGKGLGDDPIYVYCDMTSGTTSVKHDSESPMNVGHCAGTGCYTRTVTYDATMEQMSALAKYSTECHQSIRYDCNNAPLELNNIAYGWWNDRSGSAKYFWSGVDEDEHICQCGIEGNCVDPYVKCNCDAMNPVQLFDSGFITDKNLLPITALNFGRTQLKTSSGVHTLGSFECSGQVTTIMPASCEDLWRMGHALSGFYSVMGLDKMETVFCDFKKLPDETGFEKWIGFADVKSAPTFFHIKKSVEFREVGVPIPFEYFYINTGEAMNLESGIFTATRTGTYFFSFAGAAKLPIDPSLQSFVLGLYNNDQTIDNDSVELIVADNCYEYVLLTIQTMLELESGDQISLRISSKSPESYLAYVRYFTGWMLDEK